MAACILALVFAVVLFSPTHAHAAASGAGASIVVATGADVPIDETLPAEYRMPEEYTQNAVQFRTGDGVLLCGYVLGQGEKGITLAHANGWMVNSWLPFARRLVNAGYMVILWEFRNIAPSGFAPEAESQRWDLDVLAAAQVLRERGATHIICMGASDGGNATAVAAPLVPDLAGLALLSSPANSKGNGPEALAKISAPAFFAVSTEDPGGNFYPEVEALYDACASPQKEFHVLTSYEHGTDLLSDVDVYSAKIGSTEAQKQERRQLADDLMRFVDEAFGGGTGTADNSAGGASMPATEAGSGAGSAPAAPGSAGSTALSSAPKETGAPQKPGGMGSPLLGAVTSILLLAALLCAFFVLFRRNKQGRRK